MGNRRGQVTRVAVGRRFEESLLRYHAILERRGVGDVDRNSPRMVRTPKGWVPAKGGAPVDFQGVVRIPEYGSLAVAFDAKVLPRARWTFTYPLEQRHQVASLLRKAKLGAAAFVLCEAREPAPGFALLVGGIPTLEALALGRTIRLADLTETPDGPRGWRYPTIPYAPGIGYAWRDRLVNLLSGGFPAAREGV